MMHTAHNLPYSRKGLEDLATALGVNSAYLWVSPTNGRLDIKSVAPESVQRDFCPQTCELEEEEAE